MKRFADFSEEKSPLEGDKMRIDDVINKEVIVCSFKISQSKFSENKAGKYVTIQIKFGENDNPKVIFTGSEVLAGQCQKYENNIPFVTVIKKINKYYTFT